MAFLRDVHAGHSSPVVYTDPRNGDLVIMGQAYDTATMMPKLGRDVVMTWDQSNAPSDQTTTHFDVDSYHRHAPMSGDANFYRMGTVFSAAHPFATRSIDDDYTIAVDAYKNAWMTRLDMRGRDWLEDPVRNMVYYPDTNRYYVSHDQSLRAAQFSVYDANNLMPIGQNERYYLTGRTAIPGIIYGMTDHGLVGGGPYNNTVETTEGLYRLNFSDDSNLESTGATQLQLGTTGVRCFLQKLCQLDNGDIIFKEQVNATFKIFRYVNSTGAITQELNYANPGYAISSMTSNVVRHDAGGTRENRKVSYFLAQSATNSVSNRVYQVAMDTSSGAVTITAINPLNDGASSTTMTWSDHDSEHVGNYLDSRIISPHGQGIASEKFFMWFHGSMCVDDQASSAAFNSTTTEGAIFIAVIQGTDGTSLRYKYNTTWDNLLSDSTRNNNAADKIPWCVAPLNPEHTLMMVFCQYSTHVIKFSVTGSGSSASPSLEEVWFDENTIFTGAMWLPTGKVITSEWDERFRHGASPGAIDDQRLALQVWSEDMIYKMDILPDVQYVAYAGSDITANVGFSAYNANNELANTSIKVEITGPATFDNSSTIKTFNTSSTGNTVQTITISDDGQIEFRVLEVQSI